MKHRICEKCGASLDFGEQCDCESGSDKAPSDTQSASAEIVIITEPEKSISAIFEKPTPMPAYIADMISGLRAKA